MAFSIFYCIHMSKQETIQNINIYNFFQQQMIGFLSKTLFLLLLFSPLTLHKPSPKCRTGFYYETLPLIADQSAILNLDKLFVGYNLQFSLAGEDEWKDYITLGQKMLEQKRQVPDVPMIGLKNYHIQRTGNSWGTSFIALTERGQRTYVHYGVLNSNTSAPVVNNYISVQNFTNTTCFDAVIFPVKDVILVDCAVHLSKKDSKGFSYENVFYYFKISDGSFLQTLPNEMYIPFEKIQRRNLQLYSDFMNSHAFLIRSYMSDGVDDKHSDNTYADVIMVTQPLDPWIVEVLDRSFLKSRSLKIVDVHAYLGQIYILDVKKGIYRVRINEQEDLLYRGFYEGKGFTRFNVYSNNLDDKFEIALANAHAIYEIDWSDIEEPKIINKYSIMPNSIVNQVFLNDRFVFLQSVSTADDGTVYNYTWVMNRGDRTYSRSFKTIMHDTSATFIDLNQDQSFLIVMDDQKLVNYAFDQANLVLRLKRDEDFIDRMMSFTIMANSIQQSSKQNITCQLVLNFTLLEDNNRTMWPIGVAPPSLYEANYPGKVMIPLYEYVIGPNVSYRVTQVTKGQLKKYKIFQQQQLKIHWEVQPPLKNITFLKTETIAANNLQNLLIYMQDEKNITYYSYCEQNHEQVDIYCNKTSQKDLHGQIHNWASTIFMSRYSLKFHHVISYTTREHYNRVYLEQVKEGGQEIEVELGKGYGGNVTGVEVADKYLYIIMKYVKKVDIYDLQLCLQGLCEPICEVNHLTMYNLGVKYFSPQSVHTSLFFPNVIFIKTSDTIIAVDMNRECVPKLLYVIRPIQTVQTQFSFLISLNHLVVTAIPNSVIQYDISRIYLKDVKQTKKYPLYGYKLPKNYDTDTSEYGNSIFVTTVSQAGDYQIFVYRAGYPAVGTLYDIIDLFTYQPVLLDASGSYIDYVTVISGQQLRIFRQYQLPLAQIQNVGKDYKFWLQYFNLVTHTKLQMIQVNVLNLPTNITVNPEVNDIMKTKNLLFSGHNQLSEIDDDGWFEGNVLKIQADCYNCAEQVKILNHIHQQAIVNIFNGLTSYNWGSHGGSLQTFDSLLRLYHNGTVSDIVSFPQSSQTYCLLTSSSYNSKYQVSACVNAEGVNLYVTSFVSSKGYAFEPYSSKAEQLVRIDAVNEIVMVVDSSANPFFKGRPGGVILYALNEDFQEQQSLQQLEYIDGNDFSIEGLNELYIVNADLSYHSQTQTYRLYITEITRGLLVLQFTHDYQSTTINIKEIHFINIPDLLTKHKYAKPYDATFQAVTLASTQYNPTLKKSTDIVIVTTGVYHTIQFQIQYDTDNKLLSADITKFYLRYAYYVVQNLVKHNSGFIVISQILPQQYQNITDLGGKKSKQILTIYDTKGQFNGTIEQVGLKGAYVIQNRNLHNFDFNFTFNSSDIHQEPRLGLVVIPEYSDHYKQLSVHKNLSVFTNEKVDTQIIYIDLINDFDLKKIRILLNGYAPFPEWKLITIILFSIIGFFILLAACVVAFKKIKQRRKMQMQRQSLMTSEV